MAMIMFGGHYMRWITTELISAAIRADHFVSVIYLAS
jgi:hypothetical protein